MRTPCLFFTCAATICMHFPSSRQRKAIKMRASNNVSRYVSTCTHTGIHTYVITKTLTFLWRTLIYLLLRLANGTAPSRSHSLALHIHIHTHSCPSLQRTASNARSALLHIHCILFIVWFNNLRKLATRIWNYPFVWRAQRNSPPRKLTIKTRTHAYYDRLKAFLFFL